MNNNKKIKLLHCADIHLDSKLSTSLDYETAERRRGEMLHTFVRMVEYASTEKVSAVLIAGDMFDTESTREVTRNTVLSCITSHPAITFFYLKGNHDDNNFLKNLVDIPDNLLLFGNGWNCYEYGNIALYGREYSSDIAGYDYDSLNPDPEKINIVMLHGQTTESASKEEWNIDIRSLRNKGIDYLALGHLHSFQTGRLDERGVFCYPGCLDGRGFDECGEHGFVLLEIDEDTKKVSSSFIPFASRRLYIVNADVSGNNSSHEIIREASAALEASGCGPYDLVRLVLTGSLDAECEKDISFIRSAFDGTYFCFQIIDETVLRFDEKQHMLDRTLKGEFIRSVFADDSIPDEEKAVVIRYGLQALAGEEAR